MYPLLFTLLLGFPLPGDSLCPAVIPAGPVGHRTVDSLLSEVRRASFPELQDEEITLNELRSSADFFTSGTELRTLFNGRRRRAYLVYVNPTLFRDPPSRAAIRAVLAHELGHVLDYSRRPAPGLVLFTVRYLTGDDSAYERATDLVAMRRGYGCGLMAYREWLYSKVSARVSAAKRRTYLTPEEIREGMLSDSLPLRPFDAGAGRE